jgi:hypothetical protein
LPSIGSWRNSDESPKPVGEMALRGETCSQGDVGYRAICACQHALRLLNTALKHVLMRRLADSSLERAGQIERANLRLDGHCFKAQVPVKVFLNEIYQSLHFTSAHWFRGRTYGS